LIAFEDELVVAAPVVVPARQDVTNQRSSVDDVSPNVHSDLVNEIDELRQQGIEVDDDNEPAPENAEPPPQATIPVGEWITPTICPRREANCSNRKGSWKRFAWTVVREMNELAQFRMCFPEQWVKDVVIPATNKEINGDPLTLSEF
jgi:hypothetical protein